MPDISILTQETENKMSQTFDILRRDFSGLRTGRASTNLLEPVMVDSYGQETPINQVASISAPDATTLTVTVWDHNLAASVESAIRDANLGLNPMRDGNLLRVNMPALTEERRLELKKVAHEYAEKAHIATRNIRANAMQEIKKWEADKEISEDDKKSYESNIQEIVDKSTKEIDELLSQKETDIMKV